MLLSCSIIIRIVKSFQNPDPIIFRIFTVRNYLVVRCHCLTFAKFKYIYNKNQYLLIFGVLTRETSGGGRNAEESVLGEDHVLDAHAHLEVAVIVAHTVVEHHLENEKGTGYGFAV